MIRLTTTIIFMGLLTWLSGCVNNNNNNNNKTQQANQDTVKLEDITSRINPDEGFNDIFLKIVNDTKTDTTHIYIAKGLYKNKTVGLQIEVRSKIGAGFTDGQVADNGGFIAKGVRLKSIGQESDEFIKALADLYKQQTSKGFSKQVITATAFSLNEKASDLDKKGLYNFKLFFGEEDENLYSEIFLNINTAKGEIELPEKDDSYREPLIKVWTR
ncbi:MAG: hypothetical protein ABI723_11380 [Bacteroidia bacterium]